MASVSVDTKIILVLYTGTTTLTLNSTNTPWIVNVIKIIRPSLGTGTNTRQSFNGSFGGATAGGAVTSLVPGTIYEITSGATNNWVLPNFTRVPVENTLALIARYPAQATSSATATITIPQSGTYDLDPANPPAAVTNLSYTVAGSSVTLPLALNKGDVLLAVGTTSTSAEGILTLVKL